MPATDELAGLQRWMQGVITHCDGVLAGAAATACGGQSLPAPTEQIERLVRGSTRLSASRRLELYSRDYHRRLLDCMRESHPALCHLLGEELFDAFALDYIRKQPPSSWTLARLGEGFAEHLQATRPEQAAWETLIVELAHLERAFVETYDGPGAEGRRLLRPEEMPAQPSPQWLDAKLQPVPCLRLMRSHFPIGAYLQSVRAGEQPPPPRAQKSCLVLSRSNWVVRISELDAEPYAALERIAQGQTLSELQQPQAWQWLVQWTALGLFMDVAS